MNRILTKTLLLTLLTSITSTIPTITYTQYPYDTQQSHDLLTPENMEYINAHLQKIKRLNKIHKNYIYNFCNSLLTLIKKNSAANKRDLSNLVAIQCVITNTVQ